MESWIRILLAIVFYSLMWFFYAYSKGKYKVKEEKQAHYSQWVENNGARVSKAIRVLTLIFSMILVLSFI